MFLRRAGLRPFLRTLLLASAAAWLLSPGQALAQNTVPNPLRGKPAEEKSEAPAKPKRERSAKQKENDEIMRACGASWRAEKASLQAKGETWRGYLKDCRAKRKAERKA